MACPVNDPEHGSSSHPTANILEEQNLQSIGWDVERGGLQRIEDGSGTLIYPIEVVRAHGNSD